jgi:hypothetical protein
VPDHVEFCGEEFPLHTDRPLFIGREGDIAIDDNPYLHRLFLRVHHADGMWWLGNIGSHLPVTVSDNSAGMQAYLDSGGHLPLVFAETLVRFSAGSTTYELAINLDGPVFDPPRPELPANGDTTAGRFSLTTDQRLLLLALTEPALRTGARAIAALPSSADAALRLGWSLTKFNRKLDNVCQKLASAGIRGLHGGAGQLASNRRFRLVEYALAARLVSPDDLMLLESPKSDDRNA